MKKKEEIRVKNIQISFNHSNNVSNEKLIEVLLRCLYECDNKKAS